MKKSKHPTIRVFGQRSIDPSFMNLRTNPSMDSGGSQTKKVEKCVSFSDFLDRKLNKSVLYKPNDVERPRPFTTLVSSNSVAEPSHGFEIKKRARQEDRSGNALEKTVLLPFKSKENQISEEEGMNVLDKESLEQLKQTTADRMDHMAPCSTETIEHAFLKDENAPRKRKDPFEGMDVKGKTRRPVLVLGDNPEVSNPIRRRRRERASSSSSKRHRPAYNHYANGSGWWDCDMEGVDSEEVGYGEVWEGVGSTTFGDIVDWH
ncbi:PREDICTED: uncharacterized protein LOC104808722 [Tarenaya hassleriana]|uniref:uncharacterized protein LOC104808722 n=1 Tax=Tarenaya hassleriana TaxID=28532 RepID=UPI00053C5440|nr:PREDICTED: uncharacterized protein LOC104808722 [Tarenaya hassleriana]